jgi:hypothetical protein
MLVLLSICPMLTSINENDHPSKINSHNSWIMSDYNLSHMLSAANRVRHMNRVFIGEEPITDLKQGISNACRDTSRLYETCMFIFEMVGDTEFGHKADFWNNVSGSEAKSTVIQSIKERTATVMNSISGMLLHQVQYLTVSSQRLLDHYCLLYYKALSQANTIDCAKVVTDLCSTGEKIQNASPSEIHSLEIDPGARIMQALFIIMQRNELAPEIDAYTLFQHTCDDADCTNDGLFKSATYWKTISRERLREALVSVTPTTINNETIEFIEILLNLPSGWERDLSEECIRVAHWLKDVTLWQRANSELEPVKMYLRKSMAQIDIFRAISRKFGVRFLD